MVEQLIQWLLETMRELGYAGIVVLMAVESSVLPVPSELIMPPAGYWVAKGEMNAIWVVASGVVGSILGALANYAVAHWLGRAFVRRYGKYVLVTERALQRTERYFAAHGEISTLVGRLLPVVRHLISIPAGIARMSLPRFVTFTGLGALAWCALLTGVGYVIGRNEAVLENEQVRRHLHTVLNYLLPALAIVVAGYIWWYRRRQAQGAKSAGETG